jgi:hypothetical protein
MVLLRPEPDEVLNWPSRERPGDGQAHVIAAALSGLLLGRRRLSTELRPRELDDALAWREASAAGDSEGESVVDVRGAEATVRPGGVDRLDLVIEGIVVRSFETALDLPALTQALAAASEAANVAELAALIERSAEPGAVDDCFVTTLDYEGSRFQLSYDREADHLRGTFYGPIGLVRSLDLDLLGRRLVDGVLDPGVASAIASALDAFAMTARKPDPPPRTGRSKGSRPRKAGRPTRPDEAPG